MQPTDVKCPSCGEVKWQYVLGGQSRICNNCENEVSWEWLLREAEAPATPPCVHWRRGNRCGNTKCGADFCHCRDFCVYHEPAQPKAATVCEGDYNIGGFKFNKIIFDEGMLFSELKRRINTKLTEDTTMSGNAYYCDACDKAFPAEKVYKVTMCFTKFDRKGQRQVQDTAEHGYICFDCYCKFREVCDPFKFPWVQWALEDEGDDDGLHGVLHALALGSLHGD